MQGRQCVLCLCAQSSVYACPAPGSPRRVAHPLDILACRVNDDVGDALLPGRRRLCTVPCTKKPRHHRAKDSFHWQDHLPRTKRLEVVIRPLSFEDNVGHGLVELTPECSGGVSPPPSASQPPAQTARTRPPTPAPVRRVASVSGCWQHCRRRRWWRPCRFPRRRRQWACRG